MKKSFLETHKKMFAFDVIYCMKLFAGEEKGKEGKVKAFIPR